MDMTHQLPQPVGEALLELTRLVEARPALRDPARVLGKILPALFEGPPHEPPPSLPAERAAEKLGGGLPLLRGEDLRLDEPTFRSRWLTVCRVLEEGEGGDAARALADAVRAGRLRPQELLVEVLAGRPEGIHGRAESLGLDPALTAMVLRLTLFPVLARWAAALAPARQGVPWGQGYCPTCGSWPLLAEFRGLEQIRFLRCGLCASAWEYPRLLCAFCGNRDHRQLGYFHAEGEESGRRAATCDACGSYVKTVSTLAALSEPALLVADLATLHLDLAAAERGYFVG
jgi:FdhE protein